MKNVNEEPEGDAQGTVATASQGHRMSIALTIGVTIVVIGLIILLYGLLGHPDYARHSLGININLWWGLVMLIFGLLMAGGGYLSARRAASRLH
jgi:high-affinity Fe2+/Pb2+ permease